MWEVEEDIELSQRISVCVIRPKIGGGGDAGDIDTEDSEYQLIQSQKHSTYAAAAKLGNSSTEEENLNEDKSSTSKPIALSPNDEYDDENDNENNKKSASRRHNAKFHKIQSQRLLGQLVSPAGLLSREVAASGDTNRDPEFVKYKIYKKSLNYKTTTKSKEKKKKLEVF
ncbi:9905_t:CDS:2 [Entrophospora sp. SA101]|nr:9905_t:CDS:2 [Entrophospora sp. SA101]